MSVTIPDSTLLMEFSLTLARLIFRFGTVSVVVSVPVVGTVTAAIELREEAALDDQERNGLHRLL